LPFEPGSSIAVGHAQDHRTRHLRLGQAEGGREQHAIPPMVQRVGREQHACAFRVHQALHHHGKGDIGRVDPLLAAVGDGAGIPQRGPAAPHGVQQRGRIGDVEEAVVLAREGGAGKVLRGGGGAHRHGAPAHFAPRGGHCVSAACRHLGGDDTRAQGGSFRLRQPVARQRGDGLVQPVVGDECPIGGDRHHEARRHRQPRAQHGREAGCLTAGLGKGCGIEPC
jgi:hypothetical protein